MLIITNIEAVHKAYRDHEPRPIKDLMLEIYPDALVDAHGRLHAPHDGYICPLTGNQFRGGEYLPINDPDEALRVMSSSKRYPTGTTVDGKVYTWQGTHAQNVAVWRELIDQTRAHEAAHSDYRGKVGEKLTLELVISNIVGFSGYYDNVYIHIMRDQSGNIFIYKKSGSPLVADKYLGRDVHVKIGDLVKLQAKVKEHKERKGVKQTILERPKIIH